MIAWNILTPSTPPKGDIILWNASFLGLQEKRNTFTFLYQSINVRGGYFAPPPPPPPLTPNPHAPHPDSQVPPH